MNIFVSLRIVWAKKRNHKDIEKQTELLQELALNDINRFMIPLVFILSFTIAYHGPNAHLIGDVGVTIWQYVAIENVNHTIEFLVIFFVVDFFSTLISGIILWTFCKINLANAFMVLEQDFGFVFLVVLSHNVLWVSNYMFKRSMFVGTLESNNSII